MVCSIIKHIQRNVDSAVTDVKIIANLALDLLFGASEPFEYDNPTTPERDVY